MRIRTIGLTVITLLILWFLYLERAILTPFILAAVFTYIFNPLVDFLWHKIRLPRTFSIIIIYVVIIGIIASASVLLTKRILHESSELASNIEILVDNAKAQLDTLPDWLSPTVDETLTSLEKSKVLAPASIFSLFPAAISRIVSFIIFLFSAFYFLKEGRNMVDAFLAVVPKRYRFDVEILLRKINSVLGAYLRGQIFLIFLVALTLFICLSIVGVRYALVLAVFSGFAEVIPFIGPITATATAVAVVFFSNTSFNFPINQVQAAILVVIIYFVVRQIQDYFITPHVMGKITNLHPLVILFAVLAGGHLFGILGFILAVPAAASLRIIFEYLLDKLATMA